MTDRRPLYENAKPKGGMRKPLDLPDLDEAVIAYGHACRMDQAQKSGETDRARRAAFKKCQRAVRARDEMYEREIERLEEQVERLRKGRVA